ncbi:tetratricopeptide repeat protein [Novosphingobium profundi]|uniref:tetratricopeptide repeat protein n=1 Tax=Novosphingobium profundi TaxID=1774954 RepID=UPI001CFEF398|nr:SPOR domain-containing protein [Novosphingobium profundi]
MSRVNLSPRQAGLAVCSALAASLLGGFVSHAALARSEAEAVSSEAYAAEVSKDILKAEKRVERSFESASRRSDLAHTYLAAGRFQSAETTFRDALALGDEDPRTALGLVLSSIGAGHNADALRVLAQWRDRIPASDLGLAVALAGRPSQGVAILTDVVRGGENTPKSRQNLAYSYALSGQWAQARIIASQDVPGDQLDARLGEWARSARDADSGLRIAGLLGTPLDVRDPGQPVALALNGRPDGAALAKADAVPQSLAMQDAPVKAEAELPALAAAAPMASTLRGPAKADIESIPAPKPEAVLAVAPETAGSVRFVSTPVVQRLPEVRMGRSALAKAPAKIAAPVRTASAQKAADDGTHLVQLGSFRTMEGAERAWGIFVARDPRLKNHTMRITEAEVAGRRYFRVAAEGFDGRAAKSMCAAVKNRGGGCFAYAETRPLPGALLARNSSGPRHARR